MSRTENRCRDVAATHRACHVMGGDEKKKSACRVRKAQRENIPELAAERRDRCGGEALTREQATAWVVEQAQPRARRCFHPPDSWAAETTSDRDE